MRLLISLFLTVSAFALSNKVTLSSQSGSTQTDRVVSIPRYFARDEICTYPRPYVAGVGVAYWQADVRNRWPASGSCAGGSVRFAIVTVQIPTLTTGGVDVDFRDSAARSSSGDAAATWSASLTKAQMIAFNGGVWPSRGSYTAGAITHNTSAKTMITNDHYQVLEAGPLRTSVLVREGPDAVSASLARSTSIGFRCTANCTAPYTTATWTDDSAYYSIRPSFVVTFYRTGDGAAQNVETDFIADNGWFDRAQDQRIESMILYRDDTGTSAGYTAPAAFVIPFRSRMYETVWTSDPAAVHIDLNFKYLYYSKVIPAYSPDLMPPVSAESNELNATYGFDTSDQGWTVTVGSSPHMGKGQWAFYDMQGATGGSRPDIVPIPRWDVRWLMRQTPGTLRIVLGNAKAALHAPIFNVEPSATVGYSETHPAKGFGRIVNTVTRPTFTSNSNWTSVLAADKPTSPAGAILNTSCASPTCMVNVERIWTVWYNLYNTSANMNKWGQDTAHNCQPFLAAYLATGKLVFLEGMFAKGNFVLMYGPSGIPTGSALTSSGDYVRWPAPRDFIFNRGNSARDFAWAIRNLATAAHFAWDNTVERDFFQKRLDNQLTMTKGRLNLEAAGRTCSGFNKNTETDLWKIGRCYLENDEANPLEWFTRRASTAESCFGCQTSLNVGYSSYANYQHPYIIATYKMIYDWGYDAGSIVSAAGRFIMGFTSDSAMKSPLFSLSYWSASMRGGSNRMNYTTSWSDVYNGKVHSAPVAKPVAPGDSTIVLLGYNTNSVSGNTLPLQMEFEYWNESWYKIGSEYVRMGSVSTSGPNVVSPDPTTDLVTFPSHGYATGEGIMFVSGMADAGMIGSNCTMDRNGVQAMNCWFYWKTIDANTGELYRDAALTQKVDLTGPPPTCVVDQVFFSYPGGVRTLYVCTSTNVWTQPVYSEGTTLPAVPCTNNAYFWKTNYAPNGMLYKCLSGAWYTQGNSNPVGDPNTIPAVARSTFTVSSTCGSGTSVCRGGFDSGASSHAVGELLERHWSTAPNSGRMPITDADGSYSTTFLAALSMAVDMDASITDSLTGEKISAQRAYDKYTQIMRYTENLGGAKDCTGSSSTGCGNPVWGMRPRHQIKDVNVTPAGNSITFGYTAPTGDACRIGVSGAPFASTDDSDDLSDGGTNPARSFTVPGLTGATVYYYRITCGPGGTARVSGTAATL